uniref:Uncharacterized protein n=1 Tax=Kalanchoe fedtschenkoi TaxID=63787 RepID=A0A7N0V3G8_KALFE
MAAAAETMGRNSSANSLHLDEKWKLSKKESLSRSRSTSSLVKNNSSSSSHKRCAFTRKCAKLVKEQRARSYIMRRCVTMLICWRDYSDESE